MWWLWCEEEKEKGVVSRGKSHSGCSDTGRMGVLVRLLCFRGSTAGLAQAHGAGGKGWFWANETKRDGYGSWS
jgi:hypothetical protein